ncbi:hypothetical protein [Aeromicrobium sp. Sec7.5]|uniref:hypothetical protein n=1 Tax=Aeromicrobium sp. Sec7.5 TaxID=3121276 RepID=UPI002FE4BF2D
MKSLIRGARQVARPAVLAALHRRNLHASDRVTGSAPAIVSLTTFGVRLEAVHLAIESIARGSVRPQRMILWLDEPGALESLPAPLLRLKARGLEIGLTDRMGPHAKYFPSLAVVDPSQVLVTADDDILYPRMWLERLLRGQALTPDAVVANYVKVFQQEEGTQPAPYATWPAAWSTVPHRRNFALGVSGVVYPQRMIAALRNAGQGFLTCSPRADDIWLHYVAVTERIAVRQAGRIPTHFATLPAAGATLKSSNVDQGLNDVQINDTYDADTLTWLAGIGAVQ